MFPLTVGQGRSTGENTAVVSPRCPCPATTSPFVLAFAAEQLLALPRLSTRPIRRSPDLDSILEGAMAQVRRRARGALAPVVCVQAVRAAATLPYSEAMSVEKELIKTVVNSEQARAMQYCFFSQRSVGRWSTPSGARWDNSSPLPVHKAAVIGTYRPPVHTHFYCATPIAELNKTVFLTLSVPSPISSGSTQIPRDFGFG